MPLSLKNITKPILLYYVLQIGPIRLFLCGLLIRRSNDFQLFLRSATTVDYKSIGIIQDVSSIGKLSRSSRNVDVSGLSSTTIEDSLSAININS